MLHKPLSVLFLSNGHGEDAAAAGLATALRERAEMRQRAYPTVGAGAAYEEAGLEVLGPRNSLPSGGLTFHSWQNFLRDLRAGLSPLTFKQWLELRTLRTDVLVTVGDAYALLLSSQVKARRRFYVQMLVSAYHANATTQLNRYFMEGFSPLERFLMHRLTERVYVRDEASALWLRERGVAQVSALGNPALDRLSPKAPLNLQDRPLIALLPGSRTYRYRALALMMAALGQLPSVTGLLAWTGGELPEVEGWISEPGIAEPGLRRVYRRGDTAIFVYENRFADILHAAQLALGTAGTAHEQAASLGKPVVTFALPPDYTPAFVANQKRLLAEALTVASARPEAVADALQTLYNDPNQYRRAKAAGRSRMGEPGGSARIAADILVRLEMPAAQLKTS